MWGFSYGTIRPDSANFHQAHPTNGRESNGEAVLAISSPPQACARFNGLPGGVSPTYQMNGSSRYLTF